jgi:hypothetical protein
LRFRFLHDAVARYVGPDVFIVVQYSMANLFCQAQSILAMDSTTKWTNHKASRIV